MGSSTTPSRPAGVNHLALNVRDIEASHRFYTKALGFEQCGQGDPKFSVDIRFYRGQAGHHHDLVLAQIPDPDSAGPPPEYSMMASITTPGISHIAIKYPDRASWLQQLEHLQAKGVPFHMRVNHGMSHSAYIADPDGNGIEVLYELPASVWEGDVNAALNYWEPVANEGTDALVDSTDYQVFSSPQSG